MNIFNDSKQPKIPYSGWSIESHVSHGDIDLSNLVLHLEPEQEKGYLSGNVLKDRMHSKAMNASVLQYLLDNPHLIPEEWKNKFVYFWGTILRSTNGCRYVLYLCWRGGEWYWFYGWLGLGWDANYPSAVLASTLNSNTQSSSNTLPSELCINGITYVRK